jgi:hypothetical protein
MKKEASWHLQNPSKQCYHYANPFGNINVSAEFLDRNRKTCILYMYMLPYYDGQFPDIGC